MGKGLRRCCVYVYYNVGLSDRIRERSWVYIDFPSVEGER